MAWLILVSKAFPPTNTLEVMVQSFIQGAVVLEHNGNILFQIKKYIMTAASAKISQTACFLNQYCHNSFLVPSSNLFDYSFILLAFYEVFTRSSCLPSSKLIFSFIIQLMLYSSLFMRSTFLIELGSSNSLFFSFILRSNLMKQSSLLSDSSLDSQLAAVNRVLTQSKKGEMMESMNAPASLMGQFLSAITVNTTQLCILQKIPKAGWSMCLSLLGSALLYMVTSE